MWQNQDIGQSVIRPLPLLPKAGSKFQEYAIFLKCIEENPHYLGVFTQKNESPHSWTNEKKQDNNTILS